MWIWTNRTWENRVQSIIFLTSKLFYITNTLYNNILINSYFTIFIYYLHQTSGFHIGNFIVKAIFSSKKL